MRIITINIPETYVAALAMLVGDTENYSSRSELVRAAVRQFLMQNYTAKKPVKPVITPESLLPNLVHVPMGEIDGRIVYKTYKKVKKK